MNEQKFQDWAFQLENGEYGEFVAFEENPYFTLNREVEESLIVAIEIAKKNNMSIADLTKTVITLSFKEGLIPA